MLAEILATGDEIRTGALVDSNSAHIAEVLTRNGVEITRHHVAGDEAGNLETIMAEMSGRCDIAVVTGGLGPTEDDVTAEAAARVAGVKLSLDTHALNDIETFFRLRKRAMTPSNRKQAYLPAGSKALYNPVGTAPGFQITLGTCVFFCLPGVPFEMKKMLSDQVVPVLDELRGGRPFHCLMRTFSTFGLPESAVGEKIAGIGSHYPEIKVGLRARFPEIQVKLYLNTRDEVQGNSMMEDAADWLAQRLGVYLFSEEDRNMSDTVGGLLKERRETVGLAESCTGGLIANWLTNTAGSSEYFLFSAVTYSNDAKRRVLGVSEDTLAQKGAVHEQTAREMAEGARRISGATYGLAVTGIAGPDGGTEEKPVGTVCIGIAGPDETVARRLFFPFGQRLLNKRIFATTALDQLRRRLLKNE